MDIFTKEPLVKLLRDAEFEVRMSALEKLIDLILVDPLGTAEQTVSEVSKRVTDRKFEIRRVALLGLAKIYHRFVSSSLLPLGEVYSLTKSGDATNSVTDAVNVDMLDRFQFIPGTIIKSWGAPDIVSKHLVIQVRILFTNYLHFFSLIDNVSFSICR